MTAENPFAPPLAQLTAPLSSQAMPVSTFRQPYSFIAIQILATLLLLAVSIGWIWFAATASFQLRYMPMMISNTVGSLLFDCCAVLLLVHDQRERHGLLGFRPMWALLLGYGALYLLASIVLNGVLAHFNSSLFDWMRLQPGRQFWMFLYTQASGVLNLLLTCLLPLWLVLRLARSRSERVLGKVQLSLAGWQVALGIALCFSTVLYKVASTLASSLMMLYSEGDYWQPLFQFLSSAVPFAVVLMAARGALGARRERFAAGRVLAAALVLWLIWSVCVVLCSALLTFTALNYNDPAELQRYAVLPAVVCLVLLWPLTRLSTGWFFARPAAQSSPR
ncbi:hypothetical protein [Pseudomonas sp. PDM19]|uniref:hypothetical protein n=1 Tax=Pseudomonas sp. PDM19 TaxID=2769272 RepID=UPI0017871821|nr:hypothetical protein [Pseudomonas sp. PDM19]MBD9634410.1 hypothetical protein [Pseudomonas sp. PDM19]